MSNHAHPGLPQKVHFEYDSTPEHAPTNYERLLQQFSLMLEYDKNLYSLLSNTSALLNEHLNTINWVGFYLLDQEQDLLVLGPYQGKPACTRIPVGSGVCGTSVSEARILRVADVHEFPGHIACDSASNSEIVLPLFLHGKVVGVLDIDSPVKNRFTEDDEAGLAKLVELLSAYLDDLAVNHKKQFVLW